MPVLDWNAPARVNWSAEMTSDQGAGSGEGAQTRAFPSLRDAVRFVMEELNATPRMMVGVYPEPGSALVGLAEIEQAYRAGPHDVGEPGGVA